MRTVFEFTMKEIEEIIIEAIVEKNTDMEGLSPCDIKLEYEDPYADGDNVELEATSIRVVILENENGS